MENGPLHMIVVGLTGGIGTGKSTVSKMFSKEDIPVVDADAIAKEVVEPYSGCWKRIVAAFGPDVIDPSSHQIDRKKLGQIVFANAEARKTLNSIVHPTVVREILFRVVWLYLSGNSMIVLDIPLLFEGKMHRFVSRTVVVSCPSEVQMDRIVHRDGLDPDAAERRMRAQMPLEEKCARADYVIDNSGTVDETRAQVAELLVQLRPGAFHNVIYWAAPMVSAIATVGLASYKLVNKVFS